jgi:hypothetical protein
MKSNELVFAASFLCFVFDATPGWFLWFICLAIVAQWSLS